MVVIWTWEVSQRKGKHILNIDNGRSYNQNDPRYHLKRPFISLEECGSEKKEFLHDSWFVIGISLYAYFWL